MRKTVIATALLALGATANAAVHEVTLDSATIGNANGASVLLHLALPDFQYDDVSGELSSSGLLSLQAHLNGTSLFTHHITDLNIVGADASATAAFDCESGVFGAIVGANLCGNFNNGDDNIFQSTITYGPGTSFSRVIGGDDEDLGPAQNIADYNLVVTSYTGPGGQLVLEHPAWTADPGVAGMQMVFNVAQAVVPVPAALWLFGSALGLMGVARRRYA